MKRIVIASAVLAAAAFGSFGSVSPANAEGVVIGAGPGGVYVGTAHRHHHWRRDYGYARCRTVVTTRWRHGNRITVRRRVCD
jgi:hypothetical protein